MKQQISFLDIVRFVFSFFIFSYIYGNFPTELGFLQGKETYGTSEILLCLFFMHLLPAFLAILAGMLFISWRFKLIAGMMFLYIIIADYASAFLSGILLNDGIVLSYLLPIIYYSIGLSGALGAILIWKLLSSKFKAKSSQPRLKSAELVKKKPKTSFLLLMLSLFSIPLTYVAMFASAFVVLGLSLLLLYLITQLPRVPIFIIIAAVLAPLAAVLATLKALWVMFFPKPDFQPAIPLSDNKYPTLQHIIDEVCEGVKTKKPTVVLLHAQPTFFVMQGKLNTFNGTVKGKILALGTPLLKELDSSEIQSILAHEFAHFSGRDTLYSTVVSPVYRGITSSMQNLEEVTGGSSGGATANVMKVLLLTPRLFLGIFLEYFATIDMILSRGRELRADWIAADLFGKTTFANALTKVVEIEYHFSECGEKVALNCDDNFFDVFRRSLMGEKVKSKLQEYRTKALSETQDELDSHPTLAVRLESLPDTKEIQPDSLTISENLRNELLEREKLLSQEYTKYLKELKDFYDSLAKIMENSSESNRV